MNKRVRLIPLLLGLSLVGGLVLLSEGFLEVPASPSGPSTDETHRRHPRGPSPTASRESIPSTRREPRVFKTSASSAPVEPIPSALSPEEWRLAMKDLSMDVLAMLEEKEHYDSNGWTDADRTRVRGCTRERLGPTWAEKLGQGLGEFPSGPEEGFAFYLARELNVNGLEGVALRSMEEGGGPGLFQAFYLGRFSSDATPEWARKQLLGPWAGLETAVPQGNWITFLLRRNRRTAAAYYLERYQSQEDPKERKLSLFSFYNMDQVELLEDFARIVAREPLPALRGEALYYAARLQCSRGTEVRILVRHLLQDPAPEIRIQAAGLLLDKLNLDGKSSGFGIGGGAGGGSMINPGHVFDRHPLVVDREVERVEMALKKNMGGRVLNPFRSSKRPMHASLSVLSEVVTPMINAYLGDPDEAVRKEILLALKRIAKKSGKRPWAEEARWRIQDAIS